MMRFFMALVLLFTSQSLWADNSRSSLGINFSWVTYWSEEYPFIDLARSDTWHSDCLHGGCWNQDHLDLDNNGDVRSLSPSLPNGRAQTANKVLSGVHLPAGQYTVLYDGEGQLHYCCNPSVVHNTAASSPGRDILNITPAVDGVDFVISLLQTNAINPLRNLRVIMPGGMCQIESDSSQQHVDSVADCTTQSGLFTPYEQLLESQVVHGKFIQNWQSYGLLRFMHTMDTNGSQASDIDDWTTPQSTAWNPIPMQHVAKIGNLTQADVWVTIPHRATNELVVHLAETLRDHLDPKLKVFVEYSNEAWNFAPGFPQGAEMAAMGCARYSDIVDGCAQDSTPDNAQLCEGHPWPQWNNSCFDASRRFFSDRTVEIGRLFRQVFNQQPNRIVRVMGGWSALDWYNEHILSHNDNYREVDVLAIAPYFGGYIADEANHAELEQWLAMGQEFALDRLFDEINHGILHDNYLPGGTHYDPQLPQWSLPPADGALAESIGFMQNSKQVAERFGVGLVAYEGGQHLANYTDHPEIDALLNAANRDPRMGQALVQYLEAWRDTGAEWMTLFQSTAFPYRQGSWGLLEFQWQAYAEAPKYLAAESFMNNNLCWWQHCSRGDLPTDQAIRPEMENSNSSEQSDGSSSSENEEESNQNSQGEENSEAGSHTENASTPLQGVGKNGMTLSLNGSGDDWAYLTWDIEEDADVNRIKVLFGKNTAPDQLNATAYYRELGHNEAWIKPVDGEGIYYVRLCAYNQNFDQCESYSNAWQINFSSSLQDGLAPGEAKVTDSPDSDFDPSQFESEFANGMKIRINALGDDFAWITWELQPGAAEEALLLFAPVDEPTPQNSVGYYRTPDYMEAWIEPLQGPGTYSIRLCDYNSSTDGCNAYSQTLRLEFK